MGSSRYYVSINSLAGPPRSVKISRLQPSNWFSWRDLQPLLSQRLFLHASRFDNYRVGQGAIHPAYGNTRLIAPYVIQRTTSSLLQTFIKQEGLVVVCKENNLSQAIGTEGWLPDLKV